ncbi:MAG TPA: hypothetical protein VIF63_01280, partial [Candidatus Limnocylindrales bacterium]
GQRGTAWYEGLVIHVDSVIAVLDARGGPVELHLRFDNAQEDPGELDGAIRLHIGETFVDPTRESTVPLVPAKGSAGAVLTYDLQNIASIDEAVIEIGAAPLHIARIPLTPAAGAPALFEPIETVIKGVNTAGSTKITLKRAVLRWDLPDWSQELDAGLAALTITYDVNYAGDFSGGLAFTGESVALRLPDGTVVEHRADGHSQSVELIGPRKTKKGLFSRFEIPADATGEFALLVRSGSTTKAILFTIDG